MTRTGISDIADSVQSEENVPTGSSLGEFGRIRELLAPLASGLTGSYGLLDDAACLALGPDQELVISTDTIVEGIHYLGDEKPAEIAMKLLAVNLSDLAAKAARPVAYSLSMALSRDQDDQWVADFADGLRLQQERYDFHLIGGDSVKTKGPAILTVTIYGTVPKEGMIRRSGAADGDLVYVTGTIGDGALGLMAARGDFGFGQGADYLAERYRKPTARVEMRDVLHSHASSSMDVSDGLAGDLAALAHASELGAELHSVRIPISDHAANLVSEDPALMNLILTGGDDYELLVTVSAENAAAFEAAAHSVKTPVAQVGKMTKDLARGDVRILDGQGSVLELDQLKYVHA